MFRIQKVKSEKREKTLTIDFNKMDRINFRTKFKLSTICTICGSTSEIQMHHIKPLKQKESIKTQWNRFDLLVRNLGRKQLPVCRDCHKCIHNNKFNEFNVKDIYCVRAAAPETYLTNKIKQDKKLIMSEDSKKELNRIERKKNLRITYPIVINENYKTY